MSRRFWVLIAWVIALTAITSGFSVAHTVLHDIYALQGCNEANPTVAACSRARLIEGAAHLGVVLTRVPALGIAIVAAAIGISEKRAATKAANELANPVAGANTTRRAGGDKATANEGGTSNNESGRGTAQAAPKSKPARATKRSKNEGAASQSAA